MSNSSLVAKFQRHLDLTAAERDFLSNAEIEPSFHPRRTTIARSGERLENVHFLKAGWLAACTNDAEGAETIAEIYHPGDLVAVSQIACEISTLSYAAVTDVELGSLPKAVLPELFETFPRLVGLFLAFVAVERATVVDRLRSMGRMSARDCVALFLLQTRARLRLTDTVDARTDRFALPLSQETIGNTIGLSTVTVNRAMRLLEAQGHLEREGRMMRLPQRDSLARDVDFIDEVYELDRSWFMTRRPVKHPGGQP